MELFKEILINVLAKEEMHVIFPNLALNSTDFDCIEEIVCLLESAGSGGGNRHDFG